ncbi:hypothetical protein BGZ92_010846 [Podila epicladia]|nr:hypothetical protein BGZ92_010846 [Podila epicladia]
MAPDPVIVIVGAGIAGLTLAIMLERAGMPRYVVLERHAALKPLGSALLLSAMSLRCFDQLGLLPEIIKISKPQVGSVWLDEHMNYLGDFDGSFIGKRYGYFNVVMTRPDLVDILARHVPAHKIHYSKKVLSLTQTSESATVRCSDYSVYQGDIVIGADGAYSGIRQNIYKAIQAEYQEINVASLDNKRLNSVVKPLPISDMAPLRFDQHAIVGVTGKLDADKYPFLREKACQSITVFRGSLSFWLFPLAHDRIAWCIGSRDFSVYEQDRERSLAAPTSSNGTPTTTTSTSVEPVSQSAVSNIVGIAPGGFIPPQRIEPFHPFVPKTPSVLSVSTVDTSASAATNSTSTTTNTFATVSTVTHSIDTLSSATRFSGTHSTGTHSSRNRSTTTPSMYSSTRKKPKLSNVFKGKEGPAENFKISEWAPDAVDDMLNLKALRDQTSPYGGTIGDLFDKTPKGNAVKIMLEDKSFKTWFYKRTVLVGDACHKLIPFSGVGSVHAIMDCITLMNALFDMPDGDQFTATDISKAFQTYRALRYKSASAAVKGSRQTSHILSGTGTLNELIRKGTVRGMPQYLISVAADRIFSSRPILTYLPFVPDYGSRKSDPQPLGRRDREELELLRARQRVERENRLKAKRSTILTNQGDRLSMSEIFRDGAQRILQTNSMLSSVTTLLRGGQVTKALPSSSSLLSTSSGLLALDLPKHNNLMARPQFLKRSVDVLSSRASARASAVSSMANDSTDAISISSTMSTTTTASRASVFSYYSSAIEDYQFMQTSTPFQAKSSVTFRAGFGEPKSASTRSSSENVTFGQKSHSYEFHARGASANETTNEDEDDAYSIMGDFTGSCCLGSIYTESTYTESSCSCSIYTESDLEAERGVAPSVPYTEKDLCGYYTRERSVYPYMDRRYQKKVFHNMADVRKEKFRNNILEEDEEDTVTNSATHPTRQHRRPRYDSELGERRRDSSASLVSSLFRRYGVSGSGSGLSRSSSTITGYGDPAATVESSLLNLSINNNKNDERESCYASSVSEMVVSAPVSTHDQVLSDVRKRSKNKGKADLAQTSREVDTISIKAILQRYEEEPQSEAVDIPGGATAVMHLARIQPEQVQS